ncbi:SDR family oxidoreductase [uncultured Oscillibacter sp.]|uniref:SDR family oxidoreductase n=1 Tax=uncultured Oscillibacter sp. TaxID=876091 RepID=UPI00280394DD|nr:SDR family oxidoreductase [uncultured Oscillibacter sp.]
MAHAVFDISGKRAFVTGSGSGIGLGIAEGFLEAGAAVVLHSQSDRAVKEAQRLQEQGFDAKAVTGNLADAAEAEAVFGRALAALGGEVDILVNCAGTQYRAAALEFPLEKFDEVMDVNLRTVFLLSKLAAENMMPRGGGKIINIASMQSFFGIPGTPAYAASKGAVAQLTKALGSEWMSRGIQVNALAPGWIATKLAKAVVEDEARTREIMSRLPAGRWGVPADFRGPAIFLASAASDYLSGVILPVDGGYLAR